MWWKLIGIIKRFIFNLIGWNKDRLEEVELKVQEAAQKLSEQQQQEKEELEQEEAGLEEAIQQHQEAVEQTFTSNKAGADAVADSLNDFFQLRVLGTGVDDC